MNEKNHCGKFDKAFQDSVDEAFSSLGEPVKKSLYFNLEQKFLIPRQEIPKRIDDFSNALERILSAGAKYVELLIMRNLYLKVNCSYKWEGPKWLVPNLTFKEYVELIKFRCEDEEKIEPLEVIVDAGERQEQRK